MIQNIVQKIADPFTKRENERLTAQAEDAQAQLDYMYMMTGVEPLDEEDKEAEDGGARD